MITLSEKQSLKRYPEGVDETMIVAGVDEAGRGPLAGPVVAAAVILPLEFPMDIAEKITDSKQLKETTRLELSQAIYRHAHVGVCSLPARMIDSMNIRNASLEAMARAVNALPLDPDLILVDGRDRLPGIDYSRAIIKGDTQFISIAAASIIAKTARDMAMMAADLSYPSYGFARHKGYPTKKHSEALQIHGPTRLHRKSYAPVRQYLKAS